MRTLCFQVLDSRSLEGDTRTKAEHEMSRTRGYDVRAVANVVLKRARTFSVPITNLHLNKSLFFMHVDYMRDLGQPLVSAKIEAWDHGPVFREVYNQFKRFKRDPITRLAERVDYQTGQLVVATEVFPPEVISSIEALADLYVNVPTCVLYDVSHAKGGAWDAVWSGSDRVNIGMEITEDIIRRYEIPKGRRIRVT